MATTWKKTSGQETEGAPPMSTLRTYTWLGAVCLLALLWRIWIPWPFTFARERVNFQDVDTYYHVRLMENFLAHPPVVPAVDPYLAGPETGQIPTAPFFTMLLGFAAWLLPFSPHTVAALASPVLGALIPAVVFFPVRRMSTPLTALMAAAITAILPGVFLRVSQLGSPDQHVAESLLGILTFALLVYGRGILAGIVLAAYLLNWVGGAFWVGVLLIAIFVECAIQARWRQDYKPVAQQALIMAGIGLVLFLPYRQILWGSYTIAASIAALLAFGYLLLLGWKRVYGSRFAALTLGPVIAGWMALIIFDPPFWRPMTSEIGNFLRPTGWRLHVVELKPLFYFTDEFSTRAATLHYGYAIFLAMAGMALFWRRVLVSNPVAGMPALLTTGTLLLLATLAQNRMGYYLAPFVAIFTALLAGEYIKRFRWPVIAVLALGVAYPCVEGGLRVLRRDASPRGDWQAAMEWIRKNTPEPFGDPGYYYARYEPPTKRPDYTVLSWCDYGYLINTLGRRVPATNPTQAQAFRAARFFTAEQEEDALEIAGRLRARYIVVSAELPFSPMFDGNKIGTMIDWAGKDIRRYMLRLNYNGRLISLYTPEYFQTMTARLYLFDGQAAPESNVHVVEERNGNVVSVRRFSSYSEAKLAVRGPQFHIVSTSFDESCVPVAGLEKIVQRSVFSEYGTGAVKIYEVLP
jgi:asparagine N-glycosylation enzyme membrane subunit Stt3